MELPEYEPYVPIFTPWQVIEPKFRYRLTTDEITWWTWVDAVNDPLNYIVNPIDVENANRFSSYILQI